MAKSNEELAKKLPPAPTETPSGVTEKTVNNFNTWLDNTQEQQTKRLMTLMKTDNETDVIRIFEGFREQCNLNAKLMTCSPQSLRTCFVKSAETTLIPGAMQECVYLPFWNKDIKRHEAVWVPMYYGLIRLMYESGYIDTLNSAVVYEKDEFQFELGTNQHLKHVPSFNSDRGKRVCVWIVVKLKNGSTVIRVFGMKFVNQIRAKAKGGQSASSPWSDDSEVGFDAMAIKTAIKQAKKFIPSNIKLAKAVDYDDQNENLKPKPQTGVVRVSVDKTTPTDVDIDVNEAGSSNTIQPIDLKEVLGLKSGDKMTIKFPVAEGDNLNEPPLQPSTSEVSLEAEKSISKADENE